MSPPFQGSRAPFGGDQPGSPSNPFASTTTTAALTALAPTGPDEIWIANPAAPRGKTRMCVNGARTAYILPSGETIAAGAGDGASPLATLASGLTTAQTVYQSPLIPDAILVAGTMFHAMAEMEIKSVSGGIGSQLAYNIGNAAGDPGGAANIAENGGLTASTGGTYPPWFNHRYFQFNGSNFVGPSGQATNITTPQTSGLRALAIGTFGAGATRVFFTAKPNEANDIVNVWSYSIKAV